MFAKKSSFTLAEILITMTIIGILVAILIPPLVNGANTCAAKIKFRNTYNQIQKGFNIAKNIDNVSFIKINQLEREGNNFDTIDNVDNFVRRYFSGSVIERDASLNSNLSAEKNEFKNIERTYKLPNGAHLLIPEHTVDLIEGEDGCSFDRLDKLALCVVYIDINGNRGPNFNLGTILKARENDDSDKTGACRYNRTYGEGSVRSKYTVSEVNHFCVTPEDVYFDIYPVVFMDNEIQPYSNAVMQVLNDTNDTEKFDEPNDTNIPEPED